MDMNMFQLLGRAPRSGILLQKELDSFRGKKILVSGGAGSIGSKVVKRLLEQTRANVVLADCDESRIHSFIIELNEDETSRCTPYLMDIRDVDSVNYAISQNSPEIIIHAAALKHVSVLEKFPREAYLTNVVGTQNLLQSATFNGVSHFTFISSDKATYPKNILGKTKLIGEHLCINQNLLNFNLSVSIIRFGNVFLTRGSVLETFSSQLKKGKDLTITNENMERYFIDLSEAADLICKVTANRTTGISILKMGNPVKIKDLALSLIEQTKSSVNLKIIGTKPGEKLQEDLYTEQEMLDFHDEGEYFNCKSLSQNFQWTPLINIPSSQRDAMLKIDEMVSQINV